MIIGDANGAILAYDALCLNNTLDDTTSLYGDGNFIENRNKRYSINLFFS